MKQCIKCRRKFEPQPDTPKEHQGLCAYCVVRYEMAAIAKVSGKSKKEVAKCLKLTDKQIDEGMERIAHAMSTVMFSFREVAHAMRILCQMIGSVAHKVIKKSDMERVTELMNERHEVDGFLQSDSTSVDSKACFKRIREIDKEVKKLIEGGFDHDRLQNCNKDGD